MNRRLSCCFWALAGPATASAAWAGSGSGLPRRRKHWLLKPLDLPDLNEAPHLLAARAITGSGKTRPVKKLMKKLNTRLASEIGSTKAAVTMAQLREDARNLATQPGPGTSATI